MLRIYSIWPEGGNTNRSDAANLRVVSSCRNDTCQHVYDLRENPCCFCAPRLEARGRKAVALLNEHNIEHTYREYTRDPLTADELRDMFAKLRLRPHEVLRKRDATKAGLSPNLSDDELIALMADNPRLLQRPIGIVGDRAVVGRPPEALLSCSTPKPDPS